MYSVIAIGKPVGEVMELHILILSNVHVYHFLR